MKKLREVFRLKFEFGYSHRQISDSVGISPATVSVYLDLLKVSGLAWSDILHESDEQIEQRIFRHPAKGSSRLHPDWAEVRLEFQKKGVTLLLLWNEYRKDNPDGLGYTQFTKYYKRYAKTLDPVMRFVHKAGEKTFVDYAGLTMEWLEPKTSEVRKAQIFVGCLGSSSLIFAEATESQSMPDWIGSHVRMFEAFGGTTKTLIPDNLKSGITKPHRYDPDINPTYHQMALHYNIAVVPARVVRPRDKAKVESAVQIVERSIIAPLRNQTFLSLHELNQAIKAKLFDLNNKPMQRIGLSRKEQYEKVERQALGPLPLDRFELQEWKKAKVHIDYHIYIDKHFYSVPYKLVGNHVDVAISQNRIEIFHQSARVAVHQRDNRPNQFTTLEAHMPSAHVAYLQEERDASIVFLTQWAKKIGPNASLCVEYFFKARHFPQQAIRAVLGLRRLAQQYGTDAFEKACEKANDLHQYRYKTVESILKHRLYEVAAPATKTINKLAIFRGPSYFKGEPSC